MIKEAYYYKCEACGKQHLRTSGIGQKHLEFEMDDHIKDYSDELGENYENE